MTRVMLAVLFASAAASAQQGETAARIERQEPPAIGTSPPQRQANWVDEAASPAAGAIAGESADRDSSPSAPEVRLFIAQLANTALTPGSLHDASQMLCAEDRSRVGEQIKQMDLTEHDKLIQRFREQWKTRYGEDFDMQRQVSVVADYYVLSGLRSAEEAIIAAHQSPGRAANGQPQRPAEPSQDHRRAATVVVPPNPQQRQPAMILMLMNETPAGADWRLNTPNTLSAERLRQNLNDRLSRFLDGQSRWPADPREAYRLIGYHVLATFNDQPADRPRQEAPDAPQPSQQENPSLDT